LCSKKRSSTTRIQRRIRPGSGLLGPDFRLLHQRNREPASAAGAVERGAEHIDRAVAGRLQVHELY
jgi:hypothetical protein